MLKNTHHEILPCEADRVDGPLDVDCGYFLWAAGVRKMDLCSSPLGDVLDVVAVASLHEKVVLRCDVQVGGDRDGARQTSSQVLQQQSCASLGNNKMLLKQRKIHEEYHKT